MPVLNDVDHRASLEVAVMQECRGSRPDDGMCVLAQGTGEGIKERDGPQRREPIGRGAERCPG